MILQKLEMRVEARTNFRHHWKAEVKETLNYIAKAKLFVGYLPSTIDFILFGDNKYVIKFFKSDE